MKKLSELIEQTVPDARPGRMFPYKAGIKLELPADFVAETCPKCLETFWSENDSRDATVALRPAFIALQQKFLKESLKRLFGDVHSSADLRRLERACGIVPTYIGTLLSGRKEIDRQLAHMIRCIVAKPELLDLLDRGRQSWLEYDDVVLEKK